MDKPKIEVRRSAIVIHNYEPGDCVQLEEFFKVYNKTTRLREDRIITYDEYSKDLYLPRGFDLNILSDFLYSEPYFSPEYDEYDSELYFRLVNPPRDDVQREAIHFIAGLSKYEDIKNEPQLCVNLNTGAGKTYVTIACSTYLGVRSIMITSSNGWIEQWADRILEYTDTAPSEIYKLIGISSIAMILHNKVKIKNIKYILASHMTIKSYGDKYGWDKVRDLFKKLRVGIKIYDEAHLDFDNICKIDFVTNTFKTLYLTATPARSDRTEDLIYQASFKMCPKIDLFNKETDPRTHYMAILYNSYPDQKVINKCNNPWKKMFDPNAYCKYIIKNPRFYNMLKIILEEIFIRGKALIYVGLNEAALIIRSWIIIHYPWLKDEVGIYTSIVDKKTKELEKEKMIILTTTRSAGAALDIHGLKVTVVLSEIFKSKVLARQSLGRTRDYDTLYIELVDVGMEVCKYCFTAKQKVFEEYALDTKIIQLDDKDINERIKEINKNEEERLKTINSNTKPIDVIQIKK